MRALPCFLILLVGSLRARDLAPSKEKESAMGAAMAVNIVKRASRLTDPAVNAYMDRLGRQLAAQVNRVDWEFAVIRDDSGGSTREPLSLPGGYIFIPASLILAAGNEAELAGMLAHSMAHVANRDSVRLAARPGRLPIHPPFHSSP